MTAKRPYSQLLFYFKSFKQYVVLLALLILLIGAINIFINQKFYQKKLADKLNEKAGIELLFDNLHINLFSGLITGENINVTLHKTGLKMALSQFKIQFKPWQFLLFKIRLRTVEADRIFIDMSEVIKKTSDPEKKAPSTLPTFLKRLSLNYAKINQLFINRGEGGFIALDDIRLESNFSNVLTNQPMMLSAKNLSAITPKVQNFIDQVTLKGYFVLDLSKEHLLSQTESKGNIEIRNFLLAIDKKPKPWLTNPAWDNDLEPILLQHFDAPLPKHKTYLFLKEVSFGTKLLHEQLTIDNLKIHFGEAKLSGSIHWNVGSEKFSLQLAAPEPLPISKLPLGQAQLRTAFQGLKFNLEASGNLKTLTNNDIKLTLNATGTGNQVHPEAGDLHITLNSHLRNSLFTTDDLTAKLADGVIYAGGIFNLENKSVGLKFKSENFDVQTVIRLFSTINIPALANGQGFVQGSILDPRIEADLTSANAAYEFLNFGAATAKLRIENKNLNLAVNSQNSDVGVSSLSLSINNVYDSFAQILNLKTEFKDLAVEKLINTQNIKGLASGNFDLKRSENRNLGSGFALVTNLKFFDHDYGKVSAPFVLKNKHLELSPIEMEFFDPVITFKSAKGLQFDFNELGYTFSGTVVNDFTVKGEFRKAQKQLLNIQGEAKNLSLIFLEPFYPIDFSSATTTAQFRGQYHIYEPLASEFDAKVTALNLETPDGDIVLNKPANMSYKNKIFGLQHLEIKHGTGFALLDGTLGLENGTALKVTGQVDVNPWAEMNPFVSYSENPISVDVLVKGETFKPDVFGKIKFQNDTVEFRKIPSDFEEMNGTLTFDGKKISSDDFRLLYSDGEIQVTGWLKHDYNVISNANFKLLGREIPVHMQNGMDLLTDMDLVIQGESNLKISGKMNIVQGQYSQNYGITNFIIKPQETFDVVDETRWAMLPINTEMAIEVKNTGEFLVKNNLAYLELNVDVDLLGSLKTPMLSGQVDFLNGKIHTLGVYFEEATGYAQFREGPVINPNINLKASTQIQNYSIIAHANGTLDNLKLLLDSNPTLDRKDIMSLLFYGQTSDQLVDNASNSFLQTAAITQLASALSQPLSRVAGLDYFNVSQRQETSLEATQRISIGKSLTQRLNLAFTSDLNNEDPERAIEMGFQVFDAFSLIFAKDFSDRYRLDLSLKFESY